MWLKIISSRARSRQFIPRRGCAICWQSRKTTSSAALRVGSCFPLKNEFDCLARDLRAITEHQFEITQRELAFQNGENPDDYTSDHVGFEEPEESGYSS